MQFNWKSLLPHLVAIVLFALVAIVYCKPALEGKVLQQSDVTQWKGMAQNSFAYKEKYGTFPLWTNGMFSGMPAFQIAGTAYNPIAVGYLAPLLGLGLPNPIAVFFLASLCFYFLTQAMGIRPAIGMVTALGYAYATYNPIIVAAGHETKMLALAYMPALFGALYLLFRKYYAWGTALTALSLSFLLAANHLQITYYTLLTLVFFVGGFVVYTAKEKDYRHLWRSLGLALLAGALGIMTNAVILLTTFEYSKRTIRGGSQLADAKTAVTQTGLSKDYALSYSVFKTEPLVMMFPRLYGGSSFGLEVPETESKAIAALQQMPQELAQQIQGALRFYWGGIDGVGTSGPPYVGAVLCFLALLGLVLVEGKHKHWMAAAFVLTLLMSWGKYFEAFNVGLLKYLPFYAKFRAPSMILVIPTFLICCMAALSLEKIFAHPNKGALVELLRKKGWWPVAAVFGIALLVYFSADFSNDTDKMLLQNVSAITDPAQKAAIEAPVRSFVNGLQEDRKALFLGDLFRSLLFCALTAGVLLALLKSKINPLLLTAGLGILLLVDLFGINTHYLSSKNFIEAEENNQAFVPTAADTEILRDTGYYRVLNLSQGIESAFNSGALTAYFHRSIGGYHPAKLSLYQDLIEKQLYKFPNCLPVLNMLNTKYLILPNPQTNQPTVQQNSNALGAAWLVKGIRKENGPAAVMQALDQFNPADSAVAEATVAQRIQFKGGRDSLAKINLVYNHNDEIVYEAESAQAAFAVFSEVYYDAGWKATIDGKEAEIFPVNYVLRGLDLPAGKHRIVFQFEPQSYQLGNKAAMASSAIIWLLLLGALVSSWRKKQAA